MIDTDNTDTILIRENPKIYTLKQYKNSKESIDKEIL